MWMKGEAGLTPFEGSPSADTRKSCTFSQRGLRAECQPVR